MKKRELLSNPKISDSFIRFRDKDCSYPTSLLKIIYITFLLFNFLRKREREREKEKERQRERKRDLIERKRVR